MNYITVDDLFTFSLLIVSVISLVVTIINKKK
ncbi:MAG: putative holin-like toxin [Acutalibacteraceae bacterium]